MAQPSSLVSKDYYSARQRFLSKAKASDATCRSAALSVKGPGDRDLFIDVACLGNPNARKALIHLSGVHGIEGFIGSGIQSVALCEGFVIPDDTALVFVHALNPFGFAWLRRTNENNVDLSRNGLPADQFAVFAKKSYRRYSQISERLGIERATFDSQAFAESFARLTGELGEAELKQALAGGQYAHPAGLFYGGTELQESYVVLRKLLRECIGSVNSACAIDVHSGLGPKGLDSLLVEYGPNDTRFKWLSEAFPFRVMPLAPNEGVAYRASGLSFSWLEQEFKAAKWYSFAQEFGTFPIPKVLSALIEENVWHHNHEQEDLDALCKANLKEMFCSSDPDWEAVVIDRGILAIYRALKQIQNQLPSA